MHTTIPMTSIESNDLHFKNPQQAVDAINRWSVHGISRRLVVSVLSEIC